MRSTTKSERWVLILTKSYLSAIHSTGLISDVHTMAPAFTMGLCGLPALSKQMELKSLPEGSWPMYLWTNSAPRSDEAIP